MAILHVLALKQKEKLSFCISRRVKMVILAVTAGCLAQFETTSFFIVKLAYSWGLGGTSVST